MTAGVAAVVIVGLDTSLAHSRADEVIAACREYERDHMRLPATLNHLVPDYLPRVPRARLAPLAGTFVYQAPRIPRGALLVSWPAAGSSAPEARVHTLRYVTPFSRPTYVFEADRWFGRR